MKIIDETGAVVENPDLTLGYLTADTEEITHPAVEGVEEQWHWETVTEYPNGGKDVQRVVDVLGVQAQEIMSAETMEEAKALYERCPRLLKEKVKAILIKSGFEEIVQEK